MLFSQIRVLYAFVAVLGFLVALGFVLLFKRIVGSKGNLVIRLLSINTDFVKFSSGGFQFLSPCGFRETPHGFEVYYQRLIV